MKISNLLYIAAFFTGAAGLIYEIIWDRYLLLILGSTTLSATEILATFIGGLALGSFAFVKFSRKIKRPLIIYCGLEIIIAVYSLVYSMSLKYFTQGALITFHRNIIDIFQVLSYLSLLLPTFAMGASFPLLVAAQKNIAGKSLRAPGFFYGFDTLGATIGALLTGFILIPSFGMEFSLWIGISLTMLSAVIVLLIELNKKVTLQLIKKKTNNKSPDTTTSKVFPLILIISGISSLGLELVWTRILVLIFGSSTYAFTITVSVFVLGTALGSLLIIRILPTLRSAVEVFIHAQIGICILGLLTLLLYGKLPQLYLSLMNSNDSATMVFVMQIIIAGAIMLPPTLLIGASFPLAVQIFNENSYEQDKSFGLTFGMISIGNVIGVLITAFIFIPLFGLQNTNIALLFLFLLPAVIILRYYYSEIRGEKIIPVVVVSLLVFGMFFQPKWDPIIMTSGVYAKLPVYKALTGSEDNFMNLLKLYKLKYYAEGKQDVVSVIEMPSINERPYYALAVDGKVDASTGNADMSTQILSGQLPFIFDRKPQNALVIGLASGITAGTLTFHSLKNISIVEIEPDMKYASKIFNKFNHNVLKNKKVKLIIDDGRHYLNVTNKKFDMIVSEPSNPWMTGPSRLFTKEFYEIVKKRLTSNGLFAQWIPLYGMGKQYFKSLIRTYLSAFQNVVSFQVSAGDLLLIGSPAELKISTKQLQQLFNNKNIKNELKFIRIYNPAEILIRQIGNERTLKYIGKNARINTDDNGYVEFGAPKYLDKSTISQNIALLQKDKNFNELLSIIKWDSSLLSPGTLILSLGEEALKTNRKNTVNKIIHFLNVNRYKNSALFLRGLRSSQMKENKKAKMIYKRIIASDPLFSRVVYWKLLNIYVTQQEYNKAQLLLGKVPNKFREENYMYWKGLVLLLKGSSKPALLTFAKVKLNGLT